MVTQKPGGFVAWWHSQGQSVHRLCPVLWLSTLSWGGSVPQFVCPSPRQSPLFIQLPLMFLQGWTTPPPFLEQRRQKLHPVPNLWQHKLSLAPDKNARESRREKSPGKFSYGRARSVGTGIHNYPITTSEAVCYLPLSCLWRQILQQSPHLQISPTGKQRTAEEGENLTWVCFVHGGSQPAPCPSQAPTAHPEPKLWGGLHRAAKADSLSHSNQGEMAKMWLRGSFRKIRE